MSTLVKQITKLRAMLRAADLQDPDSFSNVFHAFFDISQSAALMDASDMFDDPVIRAMIESTSRQHARDPALTMTMFLMLRHAPMRMVHGSCVATQFVGTFFYFEDDQQGLVTFNDGTPMTHYYRITAATGKAPGKQ